MKKNEKKTIGWHNYGRKRQATYALAMLPTRFIDSNLPTKAAYEASLLLPESERAAAEQAARTAPATASAASTAPATAASTSATSGPSAASSEGAAPSSIPSVPPDVCPTCSPKKPTAAIIIGMAGSGKTTLMQRLNAHLHAEQRPYYMVNLDPAVLETPFGANIDIRDTVNYREVMKQYSLGPNGGILTALNLFATRFEQVLGLINKRVESDRPPEYCLFDTPGQIEIFTWSASGQIITESLAACYPTVIVYVVDTVRCQNAVTFMSNMLYACSILYKIKLPMVLAFNKTVRPRPRTHPPTPAPIPPATVHHPHPSHPITTGRGAVWHAHIRTYVRTCTRVHAYIHLQDAAPCEFALKWMSNLEAFSEALQGERSYMGSLAQSMALMLEEFYVG